MTRLAPSILAADLTDLAGALRHCEEGGADRVHVDVMDGRFVPNLTFGNPVVAAMAARTSLSLDVHLMVEDPERVLEAFLDAGPAWLTVHWETTRHLDRALHRIRERGVRAGIALNPATPVEVLVDVLPAADLVLLMSVNPGFAGQPFLSYVLDKARRLRRLVDERSLRVEVGMDGGIGAENIRDVVAAGVDVCVAGSAIFGEPDPVAVMRRLRETARMEVV